MKKTKRKVGGLSKSKLTPEAAWFGNPMFMAAVITIMAVVAFILADDWINLQKASVQPVIPQVTLKVTPPLKPLK